ncbi:Bug family tripartite tricarboxylate transporter substrate binding protein [Shumkonia mesophila]|uniref:Bug family tripartite tricarboxylate transporter substrate binding protein n=1 Tax=Shumkonia mesophila TaxID=2838854 RepID=UPI0029341F26|nr:tripartite tricarboxylate transporter substrate binding protein [Shumkonia mesophila]
MRLFKALCFVAIPLSISLASAANAADYPEQPVKFVVPFNQGGSSSLTARYFQKIIQDEKLLGGYPVPVVHMPGAGGSTGALHVKDSAPDGHTVLIWHVGLCGAVALGNINFDHSAFTPVAATGSQSYAVVVRDDSRYKTIQELFDAAKAQPETITAGVNLGASNHIGLVLAESAVPGLKFRYVQSGSTSAAYTAILGGHVEVGLLPIPSLKQVASKGVRLLGIMAPQRDPAFPDVPTLVELGYDVNYSMTNWWFVAKGTPEARIAILADAFEKAMKTEDLKKNFETSSMNLDYMRGMELEQFISNQCKQINGISKRLRGEE